MSFNAVAVTPKLVRVFDVNHFPLDLWIISEFHQLNVMEPNLEIPPSSIQNYSVGYSTNEVIDDNYFEHCPDTDAYDYQNDSAPNVDSLLRIGRTGSLFVENETSTVSAFISSDPREWGFSNHFGQIIQLTGKPTCISLKLDSGIMCYAKITERGIKFASNKNGIAYLMDEAGVRTCWDSFSHFNLTPQIMWERHNLHHNPSDEIPNKCNDSWHVESENQAIKSWRSDQKFWSENGELNRLSINFNKSLRLSVSNKNGNHIYLSDGGIGNKFRYSVFFNGRTLKMKYHTQSACLDIHGLLLL